MRKEIRGSNAQINFEDQKEKLVRDLLGTFNDRDSLHEAYKVKMKQIIGHAIYAFLDYLKDFDESKGLQIEKFVDEFVEQSVSKES